MRQIEFRGLRTDGKGWICGDLLHNHWTGGDTFTACAIRYLIGDLYSHPIEVRPETVGQFTGLHDKDENKIFEGDINNGRTVILFNKERGLFAEHYWWESRNEWTIASYPINTDYITIIGNIHEHPHLINQK